MKPRRKLTLRLPHAWPLPAPEPTRVPAEIDQNYRAKRIVDNAQAELQARHPDLSIIGGPVADDVRNALLQAASESEMLVLGSRGLELVESYFLGDTSMPVVARAERPVVLVRAETLKHLTQVLRTWRENITRAVPSPSSPLTSRHPRSPNRPGEPAMPLLHDDVSVLMCSTGLYAPRSHVRRSARPTPRSCSSSVNAPTSSRTVRSTSRNRRRSVGMPHITTSGSGTSLSGLRLATHHANAPCSPEVDRQSHPLDSVVVQALAAVRPWGPDQAPVFRRSCKEPD